MTRRPSRIRKWCCGPWRRPARRALDTILIGDTSFDMTMARAAGARAVGVTWGYHSRDVLVQSGAERLVDHACRAAADGARRIVDGVRLMAGDETRADTPDPIRAARAGHAARRSASINTFIRSFKYFRLD